MYNNGYSQGAKFTLQAGRKLQKSRGKSCGYYLRVIFFFSSLIQSLIIVGLVLFLVYGKPQDSASEMRIQDLEKSFNRLTTSNAALTENLTHAQNVSLMERRKVEKYLLVLQVLSNNSLYTIQLFSSKLAQCEQEKLACKRSLLSTGNSCPPATFPFVVGPGDKNLQMRVEYLQQQLRLVQSNFSHVSQDLRQKLDSTQQERNGYNLNAISATQKYNTLQNELEIYRKKCKNDFIVSLSGITDVYEIFRKKIESLAPTTNPFALRCETQRDRMHQTYANCTRLLREVENTFQGYLDALDTRVTTIQTESSHLQAENSRLEGDYHRCSVNRSGLIQEHAETLRSNQDRQNKEKEKLLLEQNNLRGQRDLERSLVSVRDSQIGILNDRIKNLNASLATCGPKPFGPGLAVAGSSGTVLGSSSSSPVVRGRVGGAVSGGTAVGSSWSPSVIGKVGDTGMGGTRMGSNSGTQLGVGQLLKELQRYAGQPTKQPTKVPG